MNKSTLRIILKEVCTMCEVDQDPVLLGSGEAGYVYKVQCNGIDKYAVKILTFGKNMSISDFENEVAIIKYLQNKDYTPKYICAASYQDKYGIIVTELLKCSLKDLFQSRTWKKADTSDFIKRLKSIITDMFESNIIYSDLNLGNIMFDYDNNVKIVDYGGVSLNDGSYDKNDELDNTMFQIDHIEKTLNKVNSKV